MNEELFNIVKEIIIQEVEKRNLAIYFSSKKKFFGVKFDIQDKYFLCFLSYYCGNLTFSYRNNVFDYCVNRYEISNNNLDDLQILFSDILESNLEKYNAKEYEVEYSIDVSVLPSEYRNTDLKEVHSIFSTRLYNCLVQNGVNTIEDFLLLSNESLLQMRNLGMASLEEARKLRSFLVKQDAIDGYNNGLFGRKTNFREKTYIRDLSSLISIDHYSFEYTEDDYVRYIEFNSSVEELLESVLLKFNNAEQTARNIDIFRKRMGLVNTDKNTLQFIGDKYAISRERVRQIVVKITKRIRRYKSEFINIINEIPERDFMNYFIEGIGNIHGTSFIKVLFSIIGREKYVDSLLRCTSDIQKRVNSLTSTTSVENKLLSRIIFPKDMRTITKDDFEMFQQERNVLEHDVSKNGVYELQFDKGKVEFESCMERRVISILDKAYYVDGLKTQSIIIPYEQNGEMHNYYPDIIIHTTNDNLVIIEVKSLYEMGTTYTLAKYDALKEYCEKNGYAYLMIDDNYNTLNTLESVEVSECFENAFVELLKKKKRINYKQIKELFALNEEKLSIKVLMKLIVKYRDDLVYYSRPFAVISKMV